MAAALAALATAEAVKEEDNDDIFAAAFEQISTADAAADATATAQDTTIASVAAADNATTQTEKTTPAAPATPAAEELPPTAEETAAAAAAAAAEAAKVTPAATAPADDEILRRLGTMLAKQEPPAETTQTEQTQQNNPVDNYNAQELATLNEYVTQYPDIARAESLIRRNEYVQLVNHVYAQIRAEMGPLATMVQTLASRTHLGDIQTAVPDYAASREQVIAWAAQQPAWLKGAYEKVITQGTVDEVADLIRRYKAENPTPAVPGAPAAPAVPAVPVRRQATELSPQVKKAVAALAPVASKRTGASTTAAVDPNNFEAAFDLAADQL